MEVDNISNNDGPPTLLQQSHSPLSPHGEPKDWEREQGEREPVVLERMLLNNTEGKLTTPEGQRVH